MTKKKVTAKEPAFEPYQRQTVVVSIDMERPPLHVRHLVEEAVKVELGKKKHNLGAVRVYAHKVDNVTAAAIHFAETIRAVAQDAVDERIR